MAAIWAYIILTVEVPTFQVQFTEMVFMNLGLIEPTVLTLWAKRSGNMSIGAAVVRGVGAIQLITIELVLEEGMMIIQMILHFRLWDILKMAI